MILTPEQQDAKRAEILSFIDKQGAKFVSVFFKKKNGDMRTMVFNPKAVKNAAKGDKATEKGKRQIATRKANNPQLYNLYEHNNETGLTDFNRMRCFDMHKVHRIKGGGEEILFS